MPHEFGALGADRCPEAFCTDSSLLPWTADRRAWPSPQHTASQLPAVCALVLPPPDFALALQKLVSERHECFTAKVWTCLLCFVASLELTASS